MLAPPSSRRIVPRSGLLPRYYSAAQYVQYTHIQAYPRCGQKPESGNCVSTFPVLVTHPSPRSFPVSLRCRYILWPGKRYRRGLFLWSSADFPHCVAPAMTKSVSAVLVERAVVLRAKVSRHPHETGQRVGATTFGVFPLQNFIAHCAFRLVRTSTGCCTSIKAQYQNQVPTAPCLLASTFDLRSRTCLDILKLDAAVIGVRLLVVKSEENGHHICRVANKLMALAVTVSYDGHTASLLLCPQCLDLALWAAVRRPVRRIKRR